MDAKSKIKMPIAAELLMQFGDIRIRSKGICRNAIQESRLPEDGRNAPDVNASERRQRTCELTSSSTATNQQLPVLYQSWYPSHTSLEPGNIRCSAS